MSVYLALSVFLSLLSLFSNLQWSFCFCKEPKQQVPGLLHAWKSNGELYYSIENYSNLASLCRDLNQNLRSERRAVFYTTTPRRRLSSSNFSFIIILLIAYKIGLPWNSWFRCRNSRCLRSVFSILRSQNWRDKNRRAKNRRDKNRRDKNKPDKNRRAKNRRDKNIRDKNRRASMKTWSSGF